MDIWDRAKRILREQNRLEAAVDRQLEALEVEDHHRDLGQSYEPLERLWAQQARVQREYERIPWFYFWVLTCPEPGKKGLPQKQGKKQSQKEKDPPE